MGAEHELQQPGQVVQVLAGVEQIDDLGGFVEVPAGEVPDLVPVPCLSRWCPWRRWWNGRSCDAGPG